MTITLKPLHLALLGFFVGGILVAALVLVLGGGRDDPGPETAGGDPEPAATVTQTATPDDPTPDSDSAGDNPPPEPTNTQTVAPTLKPVATAVPTNTSVPPPPGPPPSTSTPVVQGPTAAEVEAERKYRVKASGQLLVYINRFNQYWGLPSMGYKNDVLEYGAIAGGWANQMSGFEPAPPRFRQAHDQMRVALYAFDDQAKRVVDAFSQAEFDAWFAIWDRTFDDLVLASDDYLLVVGISFPDLVRAP